MMTGFDELAWRSIHEPTPHPLRNWQFKTMGQIEKPEYFLPEPELRRRNIGYNPRHLTRL
jgi:hypothetical protein